MKKRKIKNRYRISDELWEKIEPLLPKHKNTHRFGGGRPRVPDRKAMDGIFFVLRTGCQWNALNETGICSSSTAHSRFQEWVQSGIFQKLWAIALEDYDELAVDDHERLLECFRTGDSGQATEIITDHCRRFFLRVCHYMEPRASLIVPQVSNDLLDVIAPKSNNE